MAVRLRVRLVALAITVVVGTLGFHVINGPANGRQAAPVALPTAFAKKPAATRGPTDLMLQVSWYQGEIDASKPGAISIEYWYHGGPNPVSSLLAYPVDHPRETPQKRTEKVWLYWLDRNYDESPVRLRASAKNRGAHLTCIIYTAPGAPNLAQSDQGIGNVECNAPVPG